MNTGNRRESALETRPNSDTDRAFAVARSFDSAGAGIVELQVRLIQPGPRGRGRLLPVGIPSDEVLQAGEGILRLPQFVNGLTRSVQCRRLGGQRFERRYGLALCFALLGAFFRRPIPATFVFLGEVDLNRQIRALPNHTVEEFLSALDDGQVATPVTVLLPPAAASVIGGANGVTVVPCEELADALWAVWPHIPFEAGKQKKELL